VIRKSLIKALEEKANYVRKETLKIHKIAKDTRISSCLSDVEIFTVLYYGKILRFNAKRPYCEERDRLIVSKAHGAVTLYPILADLGFFKRELLATVCKDGSLLGGIPDCSIPGFETINGSLGHGLGVGCGMAVALKRKKSLSKVFVVCGDGELYEGAVWEAVMFAGHHRLDNLILIVDNNGRSMLGWCKDIIDLSPLRRKFEVFRWRVEVVDGHNVEQLYYVLKEFKNSKIDSPKVLIANTIKGRGVASLEGDPLCHVKTLSDDEIDKYIYGNK
jgi:transketolase